MKKVLTLLILGFYVGFMQPASAQKNTVSDISISSDNVVFYKKPQFICNQSIYNEKTNELTLIGNVSLKTDLFEFSNAGKVVYNEKTKKIIIYDCKGFIIDGKVVAKGNPSKTKTVEYILGDNTAYLL